LATPSILKRGFKAKAEKIATECREKLNLHACAPICAFKLAHHLKIDIYAASDFFNDEKILQKFSGIDSEAYGWSALTMITKKGNRIIIHNNFHSPARQQSNIMHEIAHVLCEHKIEKKEYDFNIPLGMRDYDKLQEEEAICLGATLQLSRPCLLWAKKRNLTNDQIADHFNASLEMVKFRISMTGVNKSFFKKKVS